MTTRAWLVEDYIPEGWLVALTAYAKVGKTTWAYALARAVVRGEPFMGRKTKQGPVLIIAAEEDLPDVNERLAWLGIGDDPTVFVHSGDLSPTPENFEHLKTFITSHGIALVIVDTIGHVWEVPDENNTRQVLRALRPWLLVARNTRAAVVLVHHEGKTPQPGAKALRGASSFAGIVDQILTLRPRNAGRHRVLTASGRCARTPKEVTLELAGATYTVVGSGPATRDTTVGDRVLAYLNQQPDGQAKTGTIAAALGVSGTSALHDPLNDLEEHKLVKKSQYGVWAITDLGRLSASPVDLEVAS